MGKFTEFEVTTSFEITNDDFTQSVPGIAYRSFKNALDSTGRRRLVRMWESGENYLPKDSKVTVVPPDKLKYYHYSRVAEGAGVTALDFFELARIVDPKFMSPHETNPEDLQTTVSKLLLEKTGSPDITGSMHKFDYIDITVSAKYPDEKIFVLRKMPGHEPENGNNLEIISEHVRSRVSAVNPQVSELNAPINKCVTHGIEGSIPFARTSIKDPAMLQIFKETFVSNFFDPDVQMTAGSLDITTST
jgi:hypothetical protein